MILPINDPLYPATSSPFPATSKDDLDYCTVIDKVVPAETQQQVNWGEEDDEEEEDEQAFRDGNPSKITSARMFADA